MSHTFAYKSFDKEDPNDQLGTENEVRPPDNEMIPSVIDTSEAMPSTMFYRSFAIKRSNPKQLRHGQDGVGNYVSMKKQEKKGGNYGTFSGVFLRCTLNILSVVYYLRLGWVVGNLGLGLTIVLILLCGITTTLTALSLSALATNGTVKGGGVYYFISRSLGADFGGTIGVMFSFATTFGTVLNAYGFTEVIHELVGKNITKDGKYDIPIIGITLVTILLITDIISLEWEFYLQYILAVLIVLSLFAITFGFCIPSNPKWTITNVKNNFGPDFRNGNNFWSIFAVFFPGCTGIMAGANISGDLKKPQKSIPYGTLGAIAFTTFLYILTALIISSAGDRDTLHTNMHILADISVWKYFITFGVIAASVSSASACLVGGPKTFQALCRDNLLPKIFMFFEKGKEGSDDPIRGFVLGWAITVVCTFIFENLNAVSKALTQFFLISYAIVCQSCLVGKMSHSPSWRPAWKYYHPITAILGASFCIAAMFLISWQFAFVVIGITVLLFMYFHWNEKPNASWGEFTQSLLFTRTINGIDTLKKIPEHVKSYHPEIEFVINYEVGNIEKQLKNIVPFKQIIEQAYSLLCVSCIGEETEEKPNLDEYYTRNWKKIDPVQFVLYVSNTCKLGKIGPNILAIPFIKTTYDNTYIFDMVGAALDGNLGVAISRGFELFDTNIEQRWPIDVWWLADDGGLIILFAHLLDQYPKWKHCKLRVFTIISNEQYILEFQLKMAHLLEMFRIKAEVNVLAIDAPPSDQTIQQWNNLNLNIQNETDTSNLNTFLRLRELILEHSENSSLILCSMLIPRTSQDPAFWLGILDFVSDAMPPFIWVHGNNENVVTFIA
ncbi:Amino acid permease family protein [Histomonas meleagridis]|uniref:Amino acid permease family protein n=1 Tax=Histomonas meleagridis TaxID=135588 RepID=UPI003559CB07|nr:Amino acid permease family protein [Histomonas meleagridis]KAH0800364.1 Amino acid permease family protein [Histomonas meleagridis]